MMAIWEKLKGWKTYLGLIAAGVLGILWTSGLVDDKTAEMVAYLITLWTGVGMGDKLRRTLDK